MLRIPGSSERYCDGIRRRSFLQLGGLAMGGLSLPGILEAQEKSPQKLGAHKSVIMIFLPGGLVEGGQRIGRLMRRRKKPAQDPRKPSPNPAE